MDDPVVVVGTACRCPGDVRTPEQLWEVLLAGRDTASGFPTDRGWDTAGLARGTRHGRPIPQRGGFLTGAAEFDAEFFGISPREAMATDPQQRLLLEVSWEALERAGIDPDTLRGTDTGTFFGVGGEDYTAVLEQSGRELGGYGLTGSAGGMASGRLAHVLGLEGPALTVDTTSSSSLVAVHYAARSVLAGECRVAVAGGAAVLCTPRRFADWAEQGGLAPDGRCKPFSDVADGTAWAEAVGVVVLERLSDARRAGHPVLAVLRGSAVNSDGASAALTAPDGTAQERVIRRALEAAGLGPSDVDVVEAHGTGTALGDPVEAHALMATYGRDRDLPLLLGSAKATIGHAQAAAGVIGLIATVLALGRAVVPASPWAGLRSTHIDWSAGRVELPALTGGWPRTGRPRRAAVSSFGISGTNCHAVLEQAPDAVSTPRREAPVPAGVVPWVVSARSESALDERIAALRAVHDPADVPAHDVGFSLATTRSVFAHRAVLGLADGTPTELARGTAADVRTAVLFPGQGAQRPGMGRELAVRFPVFARALDAVLEHLDPALRDVMWGTDGTELARTVHAQPALFATEVALFRLAASLGLRADAVAGHSVGEVAAAHVAGVLSLPDACRLVSARAALMDALPGGGVMVALEAGEDEVVPLPACGVSLAAVNGPSSVVLSGDEAAVAAVLARFAGRRSTRLAVSHAFHSARMDPMLAGFRRAVEPLTFHEPRIPVVSNRTGRVAGPGELTSPEYWVRHVREPVRFAAGITTLTAAGMGVLLELGPTSTLSPMAAAVTTGSPVTVVPAHRAGLGEEEALAAALAAVHVAGGPVDWARWFDDTGARATPLPTYPFRRRRFWPTDDPERPAPVVREPAPGPERLRRMPPAQRRRVLTDVVRAEAAAVLHHEAPGGPPPGVAFRELGFDSMTEAELRARLVVATGAALPETLLFSHPNATAVAAFLAAELGGDTCADAGPAPEPGPAGPEDADLATASIDRLLDLIDEELDHAAGPGRPERHW